MQNLGLSHIEKLKGFFARKGFGFLNEINISHAPEGGLTIFVPRERVSATAEKNCVSMQQMKLLEKEISSELGFRVQWVIAHTEAVANLESSLLDLVNEKFPGMVEAVYISNLKLIPVSVWIEAKTNQKSLPEGDIGKLIQRFLQVFDVKESLLIFDSQSLPSNLMILRKLKIESPATVSRLASTFGNEKHVVPSHSWLQTKLDTLRKQGFLVRSPGGEYSLTDAALRIIPHTLNRSSSDVQRALALARRKW